MKLYVVCMLTFITVAKRTEMYDGNDIGKMKCMYKNNITTATLKKINN